MNCCGHCQDAGDFFNEKTARKDLRRYKRRGPDKSTLLLINSVRTEDVEGKTLLDIGGGIGAIQFELFKNGLQYSINVDASPAYQNISRNEAHNRGYSNQTQYLYGDFTDLADDLPVADIVTLDRVLCCYPDVEKLLNTSLQKTGEIYSVVFPRETFYVRAGLKIGNLWFRIRKSSFRTYLHSIEKIESRIRSYGFQKTFHEQTFLWNVLTYKKA